MKFWISKAMGEKIIKLTKNRETAKAEVSQNDSNIQDTTNRQQVEAYEKAVQTLFIDFKQSEYEQDSKLNSLDSENQDNVDEALTSKQHKKRKFLGSFISSGITTFTKPFQFYVKKEEKQVAHPVDKLMSSFIKNYNKKKGSLSQIKSFPVKMLLRIINDVNEKAKLNKETEEDKNQKISDILYDNFFNKYGIAKLTERKVKEVLLTVVKNRGKVKEISQFADQLGLGI